MHSDIYQRSLKTVKSIVLQHTPKRTKVFLFGSFAQGKKRRGSDIDVGFLGAKKIDHSLFYQIRNDIEETEVPFRVDLVDFYGKDKVFKDIALKHTIPWKH